VDSSMMEAQVMFVVMLTAIDPTILTEYGREIIPNPMIEQSSVYTVPVKSK
jgi:hypothetical protein